MSQDFINFLCFMSVPICLLGWVLYISITKYFETKHYDSISDWTTKDILSHRTPNMFYEYDPKLIYEYPWTSKVEVITTKRKRAKLKRRKPSYMGKEKRNLRNYNQAKLNPIGFLK